MKAGTAKYTTFDIARLFKISRSNVQQYIDRGFLSPSLEKTQGKGTKNLFSLNDLYQLRLFQKLHEVGLSQREASENSQLIDFDKVGQEGRNWVKIVRKDGKPKIVLTHMGSIQAEIRNEDIFVAINVLKIKEEVNSLIGHLGGISVGKDFIRKKNAEGSGIRYITLRKTKKVLNEIKVDGS